MTYLSLRSRGYRSWTSILATVAVTVGSSAVAVRVAGAANVAPVINSATLSTVTLAPNGGPVTMSATVTVAKGTTLSVVLNPPSATPPEVYTSKYGRVKVRFHWDRDSNARQAPVHYTATLNASTKYSDGTSLLRTMVLHGEVEAYHWTTGIGVAKYPLPPDAISCVTAKLCVVVSSAGRLALLNGTTVTNINVGASHSLNAVSCANTTTIDCFALDAAGNLIRFNAHANTWTIRSFVGAGTAPPNMTSISCVVTPGTSSDATCMATGNAGEAFLVTLAKGIIIIKSLTPVIPSGRSYVSCASGLTVNCTEINVGGDSSLWNGISWSAATNRFADGGASEGGVSGLSCDSKKNCIAVNKKGGIGLFNSSNSVVPLGWGPVGTVPAAALTTISCPLSDFCIVADANGELYKVVVHRGASTSTPYINWSSAAAKFPSSALVSCAGQMTAKSPLGCTAISRGIYKEAAGNVTLIK